MPNDNEIKAELDLGPLPPELLEYAKNEVNEDPETRCQVLSDFRNMIYERGECVPMRTDDEFLLRFLRARNFVLERAHRLFVNYHEFRENNPDFFEGVELKALRDIGEEKIINVPPYREQTGRRMMVFKMGNWDPEKVTVTEIFQAALAILELAILEERAQVLGGICIFDLEGLTMQQAWHMSPSIARKMIQICVTSFPMKIHAFHIINESWVFDIVFNIFKPLLDERMKERIYFHGDDMESLHQYIDPKYLPECYGGIHQDYNYNDWIDNFRRSERIVKELRSLGYIVHDDELIKDDDVTKKPEEVS